MSQTLSSGLSNLTIPPIHSEFSLPDTTPHPFKNLTLTLSAFPSSHRIRIKSLIPPENYLAELSKRRTTHLIVPNWVAKHHNGENDDIHAISAPPPSILTNKVISAWKWNIKVLREDFVYHCVREQALLDEEAYLVTPQMIAELVQQRGRKKSRPNLVLVDDADRGGNSGVTSAIDDVPETPTEGGTLQPAASDLSKHVAAKLHTYSSVPPPPPSAQSPPQLNDIVLEHRNTLLDELKRRFSKKWRTKRKQNPKHETKLDDAPHTQPETKEVEDEPLMQADHLHETPSVPHAPPKVIAQLLDVLDDDFEEEELQLQSEEEFVENAQLQEAETPIVVPLELPSSTDTPLPTKITAFPLSPRERDPSPHHQQPSPRIIHDEKQFSTASIQTDDSLSQTPISPQNTASSSPIESTPPPSQQHTGIDHEHSLRKLVRNIIRKEIVVLGSTPDDSTAAPLSPRSSALFQQFTDLDQSFSPRSTTPPQRSKRHENIIAQLAKICSMEASDDVSSPITDKAHTLSELAAASPPPHVVRRPFARTMSSPERRSSAPTEYTQFSPLQKTFQSSIISESNHSSSPQDLSTRRQSMATIASPYRFISRTSSSILPAYDIQCPKLRYVRPSDTDSFSSIYETDLFQYYYQLHSIEDKMQHYQERSPLNDVSDSGSKKAQQQLQKILNTIVREGSAADVRTGSAFLDQLARLWAETFFSFRSHLEEFLHHTDSDKELNELLNLMSDLVQCIEWSIATFGEAQTTMDIVEEYYLGLQMQRKERTSKGENPKGNSPLCSTPKRATTMEMEGVVRNYTTALYPRPGGIRRSIDRYVPPVSEPRQQWRDFPRREESFDVPRRTSFDSSPSWREFTWRDPREHSSSFVQRLSPRSTLMKTREALREMMSRPLV